MSQQDRVYISELEVATLIGVYEFERHAPQALLLDIELVFDCEPAGQSDNFELALDYDRLSKRIREWSEAQRFALIETFAEQLSQLINREFSVSSVRLKVNKPAAVQGCAAVGIVIERHYHS